MRRKVLSFFIFSKTFQTKKFKKLRPKMTQIASSGPALRFVSRKKRSKIKKRMKEEEIEIGVCGPPTPKSLRFCLNYMNHVAPNH